MKWMDFFRRDANKTESRSVEKGLAALEDPFFQSKDSLVAPGSPERGIGNVEKFLEDLKARGFSPTGVVDVGANYGNWTAMAAQIFPDSKIIMIEPQEELQRYLSEIANSNEKIDLISSAVGSRHGEEIQTIWEDLSGSSFLPKIEDHLLASGRQRVTSMTTLDSILDLRPDFTPSLVKLDIQGYELEALRGGERLFGQAEIFIVEVSLFEFMPAQPIANEIVKFFADRDYYLYDIVGFLRRPSDGALGQVDLAFAKKSGFLRSSNLW